MKNFFLILCLLCFSFTAFAQTKNIVMTLHLKNGDIISGNTEISEINVKTHYGNLSFPISDVNSIFIGLANSDFDKARLLDLLDKLDSGSDKKKENAFDEIITMSEGAIPFIKSYLNNTKSEENNNALSVATLYEVMLAKHKISKNYKLYDEIVYNGTNKIEGTWALQNLILETSYGKIKVERRNIEHIEIKTISASGFFQENSFKVFANKYVVGNQDEGWLNTGILVKKGESITFSVDGEVIFSKKHSFDESENSLLKTTDKKLQSSGLVYKISQFGEIENAGNQETFIADRTGIIYLSIYEKAFNYANLGFYNANVKVK